ncbi:MAG: hypothetical protein IMZ64_07545 [Bacteroidetes bacterium]|nr:hypothetical protein [Bacteroidota bacterium]
MKRINWFLLFLSLSLSLSGQRSVDYGVFLGTSSYLGDINPNRLLYSPSPAGGIFYRYNFHPRQALRTSIFFGGLSADDHDFNNSFQQARGKLFKGTVVELAVQYEFNFFPYTTEGKQWNYTPYFAAGAGIAYIIKTIPVIPFSFGFKINLYKNLGLEAEYGFRKTFYDNFEDLEDELVDPATRHDNAWIHNNDWYSFLGVGVTWKIFSKSGGCPAFSDVDPKRKR